MPKVLALPARIAILEHIHNNQKCMCNDLVPITGLSQPTISQHLTEINKAGLLKTSFNGKSLYYSLNQEIWIELQIPFNSLFTKLTKISNRISNAN